MVSANRVGNVSQQRLTVAILLVTLALVALFLAIGTTRLLAASFLTVHRSGTTASVRGSSFTAGTQLAGGSKDPTLILRRNIFDAETGRLDIDAVPEATSETAEPVANVPIDPFAIHPPCQGSSRLVGALVDPNSPEWSFAAIANSAGKAMLFRTGMQSDVGEIVSVQAHRAVFRPSGGSACQLEMFAPPQTGPPPAAVATAAAAAPVDLSDPDSGSISASEYEAGIRQISENKFSVNRSLLDKVIGNQAELMRVARVAPQREGDRVVGVRLFGIRRNSLLGRAGIQNGDMLRTINGFDMSKPDSALEAFARLRSASNLTVSVVRRGEPTTIDYSIQ